MRERFGWLLRHYGMQRLTAIALAWPIYHVVWFFLQLSGYGQTGASLEPVEPLSTGAHDIWFGFWIASVSVPLLWIMSYKLPIFEVKWAFRLIVFTGLFDGVVALSQGFWLLRGQSVQTIALVLEAWCCGILLPMAVSFIPWALLELWGIVSALPFLKRWRFPASESQEVRSPSKKTEKDSALQMRCTFCSARGHSVSSAGEEESSQKRLNPCGCKGLGNDRRQLTKAGKVEAAGIEPARRFT